MMIFYVLVIVRLAQIRAWQRRLAPLAAAGRMPLTNYLMQTAICTTLFYGWGFGLWGKVGPACRVCVLAFAIFFAIQVPWSVWWLKRHDRGPIGGPVGAADVRERRRARAGGGALTPARTTPGVSDAVVTIAANMKGGLLAVVSRCSAEFFGNRERRLTGNSSGRG